MARAVWEKRKVKYNAVCTNEENRLTGKKRQQFEKVKAAIQRKSQSELVVLSSFASDLGKGVKFTGLPITGSPSSPVVR